MIKLDISLVNLDKITDYIKGLDNLIDKRLKPLKRNVGRFVYADARSLCPVDSGDLKGSIREKVDREYVIVYVPKTSKGGRYAKAVHDGTNGRKAQPFISEAIDKNETKIENEFMKVFRRL